MTINSTKKLKIKTTVNNWNMYKIYHVCEMLFLTIEICIKYIVLSFCACHRLFFKKKFKLILEFKKKMGSCVQ